jgi:hypothetical protein
MRFEYIVLLIIAFNVVTAVMQRRAKKARDAAGRGSENGNTRESNDEWMDDDEDEEIVVSPRGPSAEDRRREEAMAAGSAPDSRTVERMPSLGRDILDQLARDLGLKIPRQETPAPIPVGERSTAEVPYGATRSPESREDTREVMLRKEKELEAERIRAREKIREWELLSSSRARAPERPASSTTSRFASPGVRPVTAPVVAPVSKTSLRVDLRDPRRLREAFIVKEILDAPLSRRPRH